MKSFTLIEIIVAIAISLVLVISAYSAYSLHQKSYQKGLIAIEVAQNGRIAVDRMGREIRQTPTIVTLLPVDQSQPAALEILFQDGHDTTKIKYINYYLNGNDLKRKMIHYYFDPNPDQWVYHNATDIGGNLPSSTIDDDKVIAENIKEIGFYGEKLIHIILKAEKDNKKIEFETAVWSRNL
ncbi:MAG: prepilin-type N-terminal cleavage/methylation domain-containing protein [Candidatus Berkelbacteria bacterium]|nr:prepilin-type N-terminal cleavage/methylation domain-containing protein [Candidatus Berkelbacteria bacterium]